jgi:branched-subunit amino acid transport protein
MGGFYAAVGLAALATLALRLAFLGRREPVPAPGFLRPAMEHIPVSVLSALVFREFLLGGEGLTARLVAAFAALCLALGLRRDLITILGGLLAYWLAAAFLP